MILAKDKTLSYAIPASVQARACSQYPVILAFTSPRPLPVRIKEGGNPPPAVRIKVTVPAEGGDWGGGNPVALASSTYCRFTSARLAPAPVRIKEGGDPVKKSIAFSL